MLLCEASQVSTSFDQGLESVYAFLKLWRYMELNYGA